MVQLVRQRCQRPATGPADHDLPHQMTGQRLGQHAARYPSSLGRRLPRAGDTGVIQDSQPLGDPRLQRLQQGRLPGQRRAGVGARKTSLTTITSCSACSPPDGSSLAAVDSIAAVAAWRSARS